MESRVKVLGHPIHPMLVVVPLGSFIAAVIVDVIGVVSSNPSLSLVGFWNIAVGVVGGLVAAAFGLADWLNIPGKTRAKRIGLMHGALNVVVTATFALVWLARYGAPDVTPSTTLLAVEIAALVGGAIAGWLGGELVDRLGVGVDDGAHLNAPNSLGGRPAHTGSSR
jgi:uncharacterized membrane protein